MNDIETPVLTLRRGPAPLLISIPHMGTEIPDEMRSEYSDEALRLADTDWHLDRLYAFARLLGANVLCARVSRYVIDLNRPPSGEGLYPGQANTGLCPTLTFAGLPLYRSEGIPTAAEIDRRIRTYWSPYHEQLRSELSRLREVHGRVLLWEAHSIASVIPRLFEGKLPDLNFGTNRGATCSDSLLRAVLEPLGTHDGLSVAVNGRFVGGYITRTYGTPNEGVHAIQLEMCQSLYMDERPPFAYRDDAAARLSPVLESSIRSGLSHLASRPTAGSR